MRRHVWVSGRVQGVWFRQSCAEMARQVGVAGWVRNCRDGRVEAVFEGRSDDVEEMVTWCQHGPSRAVVTNVEVAEEEPEALGAFFVHG